MTSPTIMSRNVPSSSHRPFHHNNNFNANATSTLSSSNTSRQSSMSLPKPQIQNLSSAHNQKSCSLEKSIHISNRDPPPRLAGIQLPIKSAKSAKIQGKMAHLAVQDPSPMPKVTRSGRRVLKPKRYED